jgi:hypothetical protein
MAKHARFKPMLLVLLIVLGMCAYVWHAHAAPAPCESLTTQTVPSPNAAWKAVITEYDCNGGFVSLNTAEYDVALVNLAHPTVSTDVFAVSDLGPSTRPLVKWTSTTAMNINTVPTNGMTDLQLTTFNGIRIAYTYRKPNATLPAPTP